MFVRLFRFLSTQRRSPNSELIKCIVSHLTFLYETLENDISCKFIIEKKLNDSDRTSKKQIHEGIGPMCDLPITVHNAVLWTGRSKSTIILWYNLCCDLVVNPFSKRRKMGGPGYIVQVNDPSSMANENIIRLQRGDYDPQSLEDSEETSNDENKEKIIEYRDRGQLACVLIITTKLNIEFSL